MLLYKLLILNMKLILKLGDRCELGSSLHSYFSVLLDFYHEHKSFNRTKENKKQKEYKCSILKLVT